MTDGPLQLDGLQEIDRHIDAGEFAEAQRLLATYGERPGYAVATAYLATRMLYLKKRIGTKGVMERLQELLTLCPDFPEARRMFEQAQSGELAGNSLLPQPQPTPPPPEPASTDSSPPSAEGAVVGATPADTASYDPPPRASSPPPSAPPAPSSRTGVDVVRAVPIGRMRTSAVPVRSGETWVGPQPGPSSNPAPRTLTRRFAVSSPKPVANVNSNALRSPDVPKAPAVPIIDVTPVPDSERGATGDGDRPSQNPGRYSVRPPAEERLSSPAGKQGSNPPSDRQGRETPPMIVSVPPPAGVRQTERKILLDARTFVKAGKYDEAAPLLARIEDSSTASAELHCVAARLWLEMERPLRALGEAARALDLGSNSPQIRLTFASIVVHAARLYGAEDMVQEAQRILGSYGSATQRILADGLRAYLSARYGDPEAGLKEADRVLSKDRHSLDALSARAEALERLGQDRDVAAAIEAVRRVSARDADALHRRLVERRNSRPAPR